MEAKKQSSNKRFIIILLIIFLLILLIGGFLLWKFLRKEPVEEPTSKKEIPYAVDVGLITSGTTFDDIREGADKVIPLSYSPYVISSDGINFDCNIGNPLGAVYDMYFDFYTDLTFEHQIYLTGLVPPGSKLQKITSNIRFPEGQRDIIMVVTTVGEDHSTLIAQQNIVLTLMVGEQ